MSQTQFDDRIFKVVLQYASSQITLDGGLYIKATGTKYANPLQDECTLVVANLKQDQRDNLATQLTPFNLDQARKSVMIYAGRVSTGLFLLYQGDITECTPSQPPDIALTIKSKTAQFFKMNILAQAQSITAPLSQIVTNAASSMGLTPQFQATDKQIANYSYTGSAAGQVDHIADLGSIDLFIDGTTLVCKNRGAPLNNVTHVLSSSTGMVGKPELTQYGVKVTSLLAPTARIGAKLSLTSALNPLLNGDYTIYQMGFDIASRETPFYTIIEASKFPVLYLNTGLSGNLVN